jgi:luciferase-type oxidoreductase
MRAVTGETPMYTVNDLPGPQRHLGYNQVFERGRMSLGLMLPIESYAGDVPTMERHAALARAAESAGFRALWLRDVPLRDPSFGDVGQAFETFSYLGYLAAHTASITLGTAAVILPLRHPLHTAKAAASIDQLSHGRLVLGVASGDRGQEYAAFGSDPLGRGAAFRDAVQVMKAAWSREYPAIHGPWGNMRGLDMVPKATTSTVPLIVTGRAQQDLHWIAQHADGWMTYPRSLKVQRDTLALWRAVTSQLRPGTFMPFAQSLYIDLAADEDETPTSIHLGWRLGRNALRRLLVELAGIGVNHVALNLKYSQRPAQDVLDEIAGYVLPDLSCLPTFTSEAAHA